MRIFLVIAVFISSESFGASWCSWLVGKGILKKQIQNSESSVSNQESLLLRSQVKQLKKFPVRDLTQHPEVMSFLEAHPIYISLTTSPQRIDRIHHVIETLDLTHVNRIFLNIPSVFARTLETYLIPQDILLHPKVQVVETASDDGPAMKLLPVVERLKAEQANAYVLTIDDDMGYGRGMVNEMIFAASHFPSSVISGSGANFKLWGIESEGSAVHVFDAHPISKGYLDRVDVIEGFGAAIYPVSHVPDEAIRKGIHRCLECFYSDDLVISLALERAGVSKYKINTSYFSKKKIVPFAYGKQADALHQGAGLFPQSDRGVGGNRGKYQKSFLALQGDW
jgi:hypothetical protein